VATLGDIDQGCEAADLRQQPYPQTEPANRPPTVHRTGRGALQHVDERLPRCVDSVHRQRPALVPSQQPKRVVQLDSTPI
jgi:hypothetical protein